MISKIKQRNKKDRVCVQENPLCFQRAHAKRAPTTQKKLCAVRMRNAIQWNYLKHISISVITSFMFVGVINETFFERSISIGVGARR